MTNSTPKTFGINRNIWSFSRWTFTVSVVFGRLSFASITLSSFETLCALHSLTAPWSNWIMFHTYISFADIVWVLVYISCKSKIANLHNVVFRQQDVTCGQITVNTLGEVKESPITLCSTILQFIVIAGYNCMFFLLSVSWPGKGTEVKMRFVLFEPCVALCCQMKHMMESCDNVKHMELPSGKLWPEVKLNNIC